MRCQTLTLFQSSWLESSRLESMAGRPVEVQFQAKIIEGEQSLEGLVGWHASPADF